MERLLIWTKGDAKGWACSNCQWRFPIPTLLSGEEAISAYNRLAAWKFREHKCEATGDLSAASQEPKRDAGNAFGKLTMDQNETREKRNVKLHQLDAEIAVLRKRTQEINASPLSTEDERKQRDVLGLRLKKALLEYANLKSGLDDPQAP
jgi:hypothetical protein